MQTEGGTVQGCSKIPRLHVGGLVLPPPGRKRGRETRRFPGEMSFGSGCAGELGWFAARRSTPAGGAEGLEQEGAWVQIGL